jgi:hypothetical protein
MHLLLPASLTVRRTHSGYRSLSTLPTQTPQLWSTTNIIHPLPLGWAAHPLPPPPPAPPPVACRQPIAQGQAPARPSPFAPPSHGVGVLRPTQPPYAQAPFKLASIRYPASPRARRRWMAHRWATANGPPRQGRHPHTFTGPPRLRCPILPSRPRLLPISYGAGACLGQGGVQPYC